MNVVLVESPFQLLQGIELEAENEKNIYLVRLNKNERNNNQLREVLNLFDITNFVFIRSYYKFSLVFYMPVLLIFATLSRRFYVGDENSIFFRVLKRYISKEKLFLLDDGVATLSRDASRDYKRFTIFEGVSGIRNKLDNARLFIEKVDKSITVDVIVGGKLVEEGICSFDTYESILAQMIDALKINNNKIVYVPHRGENLEKLKGLGRKYGFDVYLNNLPIELIGFELQANVASVLSVLSTALFSMTLIYRDATIKVYPLKLSMINSRKPQIENLYKIMREQSLFGIE